MIKKFLAACVIMLMVSFAGMANNPYYDGLDFVNCPPQKADLRLPNFPDYFKGDCKLICWAWALPTPDGERMMRVLVKDFRKDPTACGVYLGNVHFVDMTTNVEWYRGQLKFYYTRNYIHQKLVAYNIEEKNIAFRFVVKGDLQRVSDKMPEWECFILCTKKLGNVNSYENIFVYGGLDLLFDMKAREMRGFMLSLGHNDGWYTHHPKCSKRPIDWHSNVGDYIGHYCERGWLFVSPGRNFVFDPHKRPPTGRFTEEAFREVGKDCFREEAIEFGGFHLMTIIRIHSFQQLRAIGACNNEVISTDSCQGMVYTNKPHPWITFFSMGYWRDFTGRPNTILHLVEGNVKMVSSLFREKFGETQYLYGFATQNPSTKLKLVDLSSNETDIGIPKDSRLLLYFYNAGNRLLNPFVRPELLRPELQHSLFRSLQNALKEKEECPFLKKREKQKDK